ncbi:hypothetical protein BAE44_0014074, partial [Dichanthelium oligosanthes]
LVDPFAEATVRLPALSCIRLRPPNAADKYVKYQDHVTPNGRHYLTWMDIRDSKAVSASQYGMSNDQIFFLDDVMENAVHYAFDEDNTSVNVYDMRNGEISSPLPMVWKHEMILATWLFPRD